MNREEQNGWLVYTWGAALKLAITPSPWEAEMVVMMLFPKSQEECQERYDTVLLPVDPAITVEFIQPILGLTQRRAEMVRMAFVDAIAFFFEEEDGSPIAPAEAHPRPIIPIQIKKD